MLILVKDSVDVVGEVGVYFVSDFEGEVREGKDFRELEAGVGVLRRKGEQTYRRAHRALAYHSDCALRQPSRIDGWLDPAS